MQEHLKEIVGMLPVLMVKMDDKLMSMLEITQLNRSNLGERQALVDALERDLTGFAKIADITGFTGLRQSCDHVGKNIKALRNQQYKLEQDRVLVWKQWSIALKNYLNEPDKQELIQAVVECHRSQDWLLELTENEIVELLVNLNEMALASS